MGGRAKINATPIVLGHLRTFAGYGVRGKITDALTFVAIPVFLGALYAWKGAATSELVSGALAGVAILTGLLFGLLVAVFTLSLDINGRSDAWMTNRLKRGIRETFANVAYSVLIGVVLTAGLVVATVIDEQTGPWFRNGLTFVLTGLFIHFLACLLMVLVRMWNAHDALVQAITRRRPAGGRA